MTFVKICATTSTEDALLAMSCGADAVGFVMAKSRRQVTPQQVAKIVSEVPRVGRAVRGVRMVGVLNADEVPVVDDVVHAIRESGVDVLQIHNATAEQLRGYTRALGDQVEVMPSYSNLPDFNVVEYASNRTVLVDGPNPGSGQAFDWKSLDRSRLSGANLVIAGGLRPENVADAIAATGCYGVDVASGVENGTPGVKDATRVQAFIEAVRSLDREMEPPDFSR